MLTVYATLVSVLLVLMTILAVGFYRYLIASILMLAILRKNSSSVRKLLDEVAAGPPSWFPLDHPKQRILCRRWTFIGQQVQDFAVRHGLNEQESVIARKHGFSEAELN